MKNNNFSFNMSNNMPNNISECGTFLVFLHCSTNTFTSVEGLSTSSITANDM